MSNKERAFEIARNVRFTPHEDVHIFAQEIERALDVKDAFWTSEIMKSNQEFFAKGKIEGQKEMRERAAKSCEWLPMTDCMDSGHDGRYCKTCEVGHDAADLLAGKIRALPIDGE